MLSLADDLNIKIKDRAMTGLMNKVKKTAFPLHDVRYQKDIELLKGLVENQMKQLAKLAKKDDNFCNDDEDDIIISKYS